MITNRIFRKYSYVIEFFFDISHWTKVILEFNINHFESHSGPNHISLYAKTNYDLECYACIPLWAT